MIKEIEGTNQLFVMVRGVAAKENAEFSVTLRDGTTFDVSGGIVTYVKLAQDDSTEGTLIAPQCVCCCIGSPCGGPRER